MLFEAGLESNTARDDEVILTIMHRIDMHECGRLSSRVARPREGTRAKSFSHDVFEARWGLTRALPMKPNLVLHDHCADKPTHVIPWAHGVRHWKKQTTQYSSTARPFRLCRVSCTYVSRCVVVVERSIRRGLSTVRARSYKTAQGSIPRGSYSDTAVHTCRRGDSPHFFFECGGTWDILPDRNILGCGT